MILLLNIISLIIVIFCICWMLAFYPAFKFVKNVKLFEKLKIDGLYDLPSLTVVITACNEEKTIESALTTLLCQDYPNLKIIAVNDRSTDQTGEILNKMASLNSHLEVLHIKELTESWLGKVNALNLASEKVKSDWILFTDADVHFKKDTFRKAVSYSETKSIDHFTLLPDPYSDNFLMKVVFQTFGFVFMTFTRAYNIGSIGNKDYVGCGAFNLVRKKAFDKTKGFQWLKMEVADDVGLGLLMKNAGNKSDFAITFDEIDLVWYSSLSEMFKGLEKNFYGVATGYNFPLMFLEVLFMNLYALAPFVAIALSFHISWMWIFGVVAYSSLILGAILGKVKLGFKFLPSLFLPVGFVLLSMMLLRSGIKCKTQKGIVWRGTKYPLDELKKGKQVFK